MQLVFETLSTNTKDINIKMSSQTESVMRDNINEIMKEVHLAPNTDNETLDSIKENLGNGADLPVSDISKNRITEDEKCLDKDIKQNGICVPKVISNLEENSLKDNINCQATVSDNITNGTTCTQDSAELETTNNDVLDINNATAYESCQPDTSVENIESLATLENNSNEFSTNKTYCAKNESENGTENGKLLDKTTNDTSLEIDVSEESLQSDKMNTGDVITVDETSEINKPAENINSSQMVDNTCIEINKPGQNIDSSKIDDHVSVQINTPEDSVQNDNMNTDDVRIAKDTSEISNPEDNTVVRKMAEDTSVEIITSEDNITSDDVGIVDDMSEISIPKDNSDDVRMIDDAALEINALKNDLVKDKIGSLNEEMVTEINKPSNAGSVFTKKFNNSAEPDNSSIINTNLLDDDDVVMDEENKTVVPENNTAKDESSAIADDNIVKSKSLTLELDSEDISMDGICNSANTNKLMEEDPKPTELDKNVLASIPETVKSSQSTADQDDNSEETLDVSMAEPETIPKDISEVTDNINKIDVDISVEINSSVLETNVKAVETINDNVIDDGKKLDCSSMETDETKIITTEKDDVDEIVNSKSDTTCDEEVKKDTVLEDEIEPTAAAGTVLDKKSSEDSVIICEDKESKDTTVATVENNDASNDLPEKRPKDIENQENVEILDEDDVKFVENKVDEEMAKRQKKDNSPEKQATKTLPVVCKLSNTLDILSDDEEDSNVVPNKTSNAEDKCINIDDDDDIMLIEEDSNSQESISKDEPNVLNNTEETIPKSNDNIDLETGENHATNITDLAPRIIEKDASPEKISSMELDSTPPAEHISEETDKKEDTKEPLLPKNFLKTAKKSLAGMTRHELEDFCILRIVESIVDRSNLSDIKTKMKTMALNLEDYRKRATMLTKQNRDLQVVLKSVQEEQKKRTNAPIQPLKITRSVGMQVLMNEKLDSRRKVPIPTPVQTAILPSRPVRSVQSAKQTNKPLAQPPNIPVPRKVPVINSPAKALTNTSPNNIANSKSASPNPNGLRNPSPVQKAPEKRTHSRMQATSSVTVDLTDDEPPAKINNKNAATPPVRVVPSQNLLAQNRQFGMPTLNSPRKVYIPISGPQGQNIRPGQTLMVKSTPSPVPRQRMPMTRPQQNVVRPKQIPRHPAPLPDAMKQYTPPTWKALPPAPDLKLSKVENGIVISWKIDGYPDGGYETIASYQLYAYQETSAPPCTALWKKIGDVKALPLPMACTLTQFMAGFKYYFAVRAVDVRSRLGPFSLPGSILLLNKM